MNYPQKIILTISLLTCCLFSATAQDSLVVNGKIENLTIKLYRQYDVIKISRVNLLRGREEISTTATLQADGSFKTSIPLIFPLEECILSYGNVISAPFLAQKGELFITILADSLGKADVPFRFEGLNANTNNRHALFEAALAKYMKTRKDYDNYFKKLARKTATSGWEFAQGFRDFRLVYYNYFQYNQPTDKLLDNWVNLSLTEATKGNYFEHLYYLNEKPLATLTDSLKIDTSAFMTFSKADLAWQYYRHTFTTLKTNINSLKVEQIAEIVLKYAKSLTENERTRLETIFKTKEAQNKDLRFLNDVFTRNTTELQLISYYELLIRQLGFVLSKKDLELMTALIWAQTIKDLTLANSNKIYWHIRPKIESTLYLKSLDELHRLENVDSLTIEKLKDRSFVSQNDGRFRIHLIEALPKTFLYKNEYQTGKQILDNLKKEYRGQKLYLIYWKISDDNCADNLKESVLLRNFLSESDIQFVYICNSKTEEQLWKETVIKNKLKGIHILGANETQDDYFEDEFVKLAPPPYAAIITEKGKTVQAPLPIDHEGWDKLLKTWK